MNLVRKYRNPPIIEALCEFHFASENPWDWTIPGLLFGKVKEVYPHKGEVRKLGVEFRTSGAGVDSRVGQGIDRLRFSNEKSNRLVQVGENLLTVNQLKPYSTWVDFKRMINSALGSYQEVANPLGITSLALRYINQIETLNVGFAIEEYFGCYPHFPRKDQRIVGDLFMRSNLPVPNVENPEGILTLVFAIRFQRETKSPICIIDLGMAQNWDKKSPLSIDQAEEYIEKAHLYVESAFEECITDKLRKGFE